MRSNFLKHQADWLLQSDASHFTRIPVFPSTCGVPCSIFFRSFLCLADLPVNGYIYSSGCPSPSVLMAPARIRIPSVNPHIQATIPVTPHVNQLPTTVNSN